MKRSGCLPADVCAVCGRSLDDVGGRRLLTSLHGALLIQGLPTSWDGRWRELRAVRLDEPFGQLYVVLAGFDAADKEMDRAGEQAQAEFTPWFCQWCAGQTCRKCGSLLGEVPGSTFLNDDGSTKYFAFLPIGEPACSNLNCLGVE